MARNILLLGGNGMMGFETLMLLDERCTDENPINVCLLNRGKSWDWDKKELLAKMKIAVKMIKWNRKKPLKDCDELTQLLKEVEQFDAVVDFSGYVKEYIESAWEVLSAKVHVYIYISTDSVYEVCSPATHDGSTRETDDIRPASEEERARLNDADDYGHEKLECEELLRQHFTESGFPFIAFRLPDVIGARDGTERWHQSQIWITALCKMPAALPMHLQKPLENKPICMVYSKDVASLAVRIMHLDSAERGHLLGESFNLAFNEPLTPEIAFKTIHQCIGSSADLKFSHSDNLDIPILYPSVMRGPVNTTKARGALQWQPTPFLQAVTEICSFYAGAMNESKFVDEKKSCVKDLLSDLKHIYDETEYLLVKHVIKLVTNVT